MLLLALAMVPLLLVPLMVDLSGSAARTVVALDWIVWSLFAFEFLVRLALSDRRRAFLRSEWPDLLIIILPFFRPLRIVRSAQALRVLRLARLAVVLGELTKNARRLLVRNHLDFALLAIGGFVLAVAAFVLVVDENNGGSINSYSDALWWAATTVTTVGYGDTFPVTAAGRGAAVLLMLAGITIFGVITANLAAFFVEGADGRSGPATPVLADGLSNEEELRAMLRTVLGRIDDLERQIA